MKLRRVTPGTILVPEVRVTASWDDEHLSLFRESLKAMGQLAPIVCVEEDSKLYLVDGLHRLQEALARGDRLIDTVIMPGGLQQSLLQNLVLNRLRGKTKASEMVKVIEVLTEEYDMDSDAIRAATGLSREYIEKLQWVARGVPAIRAALDEELIGVSHAYEMARYLTEDEQERTLPLLLQYRWPLARLREHIHDVGAVRPEAGLTPLPGAAPAIPRAHCYYCKAEYEPQHLSSVPTCPACAGLLHEMVHRMAAQPQE